MKHFEEAMALLVTQDPLLTADRTLGFVMSYAAAKAGAVVFCRGEALSPLANRGVDLEGMAEVGSRWRLHESDLRAGRRTDGRGYTLLPVSDAGNLVGFVYLIDAQAPFDWTELAPLGMVLARASIAWSQGVLSSIESYLLSRTPEEVAREQTLLALNQSEWNISEAARRLGLTRRAIYLRLKRYGIPRQRIPKNGLQAAWREPK